MNFSSFIDIFFAINLYVLGVGIAPNAMPNLELNVNSPFMYYIRDTEANTIVFSGRIVTVDGH